MDRLTPEQEAELYRVRRHAKPSGPPPTVGECKQAGHIGFDVICNGSTDGHRCWHTRMFRWPDLPLDDGWRFIDIPRRLKFRCTVCGSREFHIFPDWSHHRLPGMAMPFPPDKA